MIKTEEIFKNYNIMYIIFLYVLLIVIKTELYHKLTTQTIPKLTVHDHIISSLGHFRVALNTHSCQLQIEIFNINHYTVFGYHPKTALKPCSFMSIEGN